MHLYSRGRCPAWPFNWFRPLNRPDFSRREVFRTFNEVDRESVCDHEHCCMIINGAAYCGPVGLLRRYAWWKFKLK